MVIKVKCDAEELSSLLHEIVGEKTIINNASYPLESGAAMEGEPVAKVDGALDNTVNVYGS